MFRKWEKYISISPNPYRLLWLWAQDILNNIITACFGNFLVIKSIWKHECDHLFIGHMVLHHFLLSVKRVYSPFNLIIIFYRITLAILLVILWHTVFMHSMLSFFLYSVRPRLKDFQNQHKPDKIKMKQRCRNPRASNSCWYFLLQWEWT